MLIEERESSLVADFEHDGFLIPIKILSQGHDMSLRIPGGMDFCELFLNLNGPFVDLANSSREVEGEPLTRRRRRRRRRSHEMKIAQEYEG